MLTKNTIIGLQGFSHNRLSDNYIVLANGCWEWQGATALGYGYLHIGQTDGSPKRFRMRAHRASYEIARGAIPDGLDLDHLCFNKLCVNPSHLEAVTGAENARRAWDASRNGLLPVKCGRPPSKSPRILLNFRISSVTKLRLESECKRRGICLGRLLDVLAEGLEG